MNSSALFKFPLLYLLSTLYFLIIGRPKIILLVSFFHALPAVYEKGPDPEVATTLERWQQDQQ